MSKRCFYSACVFNLLLTSLNSVDILMKAIKLLTKLLLVVGGLNWGLVGAFDFDLVATLFGPMTPLSRTVYILVGLAAIQKILCCVMSKGCCQAGNNTCSIDTPNGSGKGGCCG